MKNMGKAQGGRTVREAAKMESGQVLSPGRATSHLGRTFRPGRH
jgi:hypothetical protein